MRPSIRHCLAVALAGQLLTAGVGGCAAHSDGSPAEYHLVVRDADRVLAELGLSRLQQLPQTEIATPQSAGSQVQKGPTVAAVLGAAGAGHVTSVRVEGRDPAQTLTADELTDRVILSVTKRDTVKLAGTDLDRGRWVRDVTALVVNP